MSKNILILDCGSGYVKSGLGGFDKPQRVFANAVADGAIGDAAVTKKDVVYPMEHGKIQNWDQMEKIWEYGMNEAGINPSETTILGSERVNVHRSQRENITKYMFETAQVHSYYVANTPLLALYACGKTTGVVVDFGHTFTDVCVVNGGYTAPSTVRQLYIGGRDVTNKLGELLAEKGHSFNTPAQREVLRHIKEKVCYFAEDSDAECKKEESEIEMNYELPDGQVISIGQERFKAVDVIFDSDLCQMTRDSIYQGDILQRIELLNTIYCVGESTFSGLKERFERKSSEMWNRPCDNITVPEKKHLAFVGASLLADMSNFDEFYIKKSDYEEFGPGSVHRKCI